MKAIFAVSGLLILLLVAGCSEKKEIIAPSQLPPPLGLNSITGDEKVTLFWWCSNYEDDLNGYRIYYVQGEHEGNQWRLFPGSLYRSTLSRLTLPVQVNGGWI